jgi:wyosine [tRNA(Phe)-imidazoG37] synthetase (radical SAM superfamily)
MQYVYGPVRSRRLGLSLGVAPVPFKTCNLNCVYCQLGPTRAGSKPSFPAVLTILREINEALAKVGEVDYVTISGSGEPTLYPEIGPLIGGIKARTTVPVAVITNGTLLSSHKIREALSRADVVLPSLDAAENRLYHQIARPPGGLSVDEVIQGMAAFRRCFPGQIWLEVMLVRGLNDSPVQIDRLREAIALIQPDRIQLNTVVRPPAVGLALPVTPDRLVEIATSLGPRCEVVAELHENHQDGAGRSTSTSGMKPEAMTEMIAGIVTRRPMTLCVSAWRTVRIAVSPSACIPRMAAGVPFTW